MADCHHKTIVSLPCLIDFDWKVNNYNIKSSSDSASRMAAHTCLIQLNETHPLIKPSHAHTNKYDVIFIGGVMPRVNQTEMSNVCTINVEFSKETLDTMLDGLGKIRDQLSSVAKSSM